MEFIEGSIAEATKSHVSRYVGGAPGSPAWAAFTLLFMLVGSHPSSVASPKTVFIGVKPASQRGGVNPYLRTFIFPLTYPP